MTHLLTILRGFLKYFQKSVIPHVNILSHHILISLYHENRFNDLIYLKTKLRMIGLQAR